MEIHVEERQGVRIAVEGCGHGTLHAIYASVQEACRQEAWPGVDLLIIGGDFQAVRNAYDLNCVNMPAKYRHMGDFHEYYSGQRVAPYLTIFVGGNHEASNYLFELYYGGWVAPNIYYMGAASVLRLGPLRIAGMSGIWKGYDYRKPHHERLPYNTSDIKSVYHVRELDIRKLLQIHKPVDIGISHDWPKGVEWCGNWRRLFKFKPFLQEDARSGQLGNTAAKYVMDWLRPRFWLSAHLHAKYSAAVRYEDHSASADQSEETNGDAIQVVNEDKIDLADEADEKLVNCASAVTNEDEIDLDLDEEASQGNTGISSSGLNRASLEVTRDPAADGVSDNPHSNEDADAPTQAAVVNTSNLSAQTAKDALPDSFRRRPPPEPPQRPAELANKLVNFLALDKCLPGRNFLQMLSVPAEVDAELVRPLKLTYDREWLAITRTFALNEPLIVGDVASEVPRIKSQSEYQSLVDTQLAWIRERFGGDEMFVPENFTIVAPIYDNGNWNLPQYQQATEHPSPQTDAFCQMLEIPNSFTISEEQLAQRQKIGAAPDPFFHSSRHDGKLPRGNARNRSRGSRGGRGRGQNRNRP